MLAHVHRRPLRAAGLSALGIGVVLAASGCFFGGASASPTPTASESPQAVVVPTTSTASANVAPFPSPAASPEVAVYWPQQIEIPTINVRAPVVQVGLEEDGAMEAPNGPDIIGWYTGSVAPGITGNALVTAHVDWLDRRTGQSEEAVFWNLHELQQGDRVIVHSEEDKTFTYTVKESVLVAFDDPDALEYLQPTDEAILTLITCEGDFDQETRNYDQRRIVVAELQSS